MLAGRTVSALYGPAGGPMGGLSGQGSPRGTGGPGQLASAAVFDVWRRGWACHSRSAPELRGPQLARTGASKCSRRVLELVDGLAVRNRERGRRSSQPCLPQVEWRTVTSARRPAAPRPAYRRGVRATCARQEQDVRGVPELVLHVPGSSVYAPQAQADPHLLLLMSPPSQPPRHFPNWTGFARKQAGRL